MGTAEPLIRLRAFVARYPTQRAAAKALGISGPYLHDLLNGRRLFSDRMLSAIGMAREIVVKTKARL